MKKITLKINTVELNSDDNTEFYGKHNGKEFRILKGFDENTNEFNFLLDCADNNQQLKNIGTFPTLDDCVKQFNV